MALPEFQRGYVWSREQVRGLFGKLTLSLASEAGYRCFTSGVAFRDYVQRELLGERIAA